MRRVRFEVPAAELERVLDAILPLLPTGVRSIELDDDRVEVTTVGHAGRMPPRAVLEIATGSELEAYREDDVPADWRLRRPRTDVLVGGQLMLRAPEDPPPVSGIVDVVLEQGGGFGSGSHPTTRMCVELMLGLEPTGGFGDIGCGLGALAIAAGKLGFEPLVALDREEAAITAARANADRNGIAVDCRVANAEEEPPPAVATLVVNAPPTVHVAVAEKLDPATNAVVVSGAVGPEIGPVVEAYEQAGLTEERRIEDESGIWNAVLLRRAA